MPFVSHARIVMPDARQCRDRVVRHMAKHDLEVQDTGDEMRIFISGGQVGLAAGTDLLVLTATAGSLAALEDQKYFLASHVGEMADGADIDIIWTGDGAERAGLPNFRVMRVEASVDLTPQMRRLTLSGDNLARFDTPDNLHVKLYIPARGVEPEWPSMSLNGRIVWPQGEKKLADRKYTIRSLDTARGTMDIDFVMHGDAGPGTAFALHARPGDVVGLMGPGGLSVRPADWYLLAGDETALPAIARIVENLPSTARATVRIEVADRHEEQRLHSKAELDVEWLHRDKSTRRLEEAVRSVPWPEKEESVFAWVGCERDAFAGIRRYLRKDRGLAKDRHLAVAYWRNGNPGHNGLASQRN